MKDWNAVASRVTLMLSVGNGTKGECGTHGRVPDEDRCCSQMRAWIAAQCTLDEVRS